MLSIGTRVSAIISLGGSEFIDDSFYITGIKLIDSTDVLMSHKLTDDMFEYSAVSTGGPTIEFSHSDIGESVFLNKEEAINAME